MDRDRELCTKATNRSIPSRLPVLLGDRRRSHAALRAALRRRRKNNAAHGTVELRLPLTSPTSFARAGINFFYDTGTAYEYGVSLGDARFHHALGVGAFFKVLIGLRIDMGWDLEGGSRFSVESQMKF